MMTERHVVLEKQMASPHQPSIETSPRMTQPLLFTVAIGKAVEELVFAIVVARQA